jgi:hypothetical protein
MMRERLTTLACALGALFLFATLFYHGDTLTARRASPPTSVERADHGLAGARAWLRAEGVPTVSLRERFGSLLRQRGLAASGNLLIVSLPAVTHFRSEEAVTLERWIRNGNTLLVMAALRDRPGWAQFPNTMSNDLQLLTDFNLATARTRAAAAAGRASRPAAPSGRGARPARTAQAPHRGDSGAAPLHFMELLPSPELGTLVPNRPHPYFSGVARAEALSDYVPFRDGLSLPRVGFALSLAHDGKDADAFWIRTVGDGTIIVSGFGSLFSNRALGRADNARLLANLISASVAADGAVVFDDGHQGLSDDYDPAKFYRDPRLYATLGVIGAVWLTWVLGGTQLRRPRSRPAAPRQAELVRTTGLFLARVLRPAAAARRMFDLFLQRVAAAVGRDAADAAALWDWLENHPRLARADVSQLRAWYAAAGANRRVPLIRLHNLLMRAERRLAQ